MDHFHLLVTRISVSNQIRMLALSEMSSITSWCYKQEKEIKLTSISPSLSYTYPFLCDIMLCVMFFDIKVASNMEPNEEKKAQM